MSTAFYEPLGDDRYRSTEHTSGPWGPESQHAGPPSALLTRALEQMPSSWPGHLTRISLDILGAVPVAELTVRTRTLRPGRSVELVEAELESGGRTVLRGLAWRMSVAELDLPASPLEPEPAPEFPDADSAFFDWGGGYLKAMQWRFVPGHPQGQGRGAVWGRARLPLVADEEPTPMQRLLTLADTGTGVSHRLDAQKVALHQHGSDGASGRAARRGVVLPGGGQPTRPSRLRSRLVAPLRPRPARRARGPVDLRPPAGLGHVS